MAEFFKGIRKVKYEGPDSKNPLAFKHYNPKEKVGKKTMEQHLRFSVVYWHTMKGGGTDPFGPTPVYDRLMLSRGYCLAALPALWCGC